MTTHQQYFCRPYSRCTIRNVFFCKLFETFTQCSLPVLARKITIMLSFLPCDAAMLARSWES